MFSIIKFPDELRVNLSNFTFASKVGYDIFHENELTNVINLLGDLQTSKQTENFLWNSSLEKCYEKQRILLRYLRQKVKFLWWDFTLLGYYFNGELWEQFQLKAVSHNSTCWDLLCSVTIMLQWVHFWSIKQYAHSAGQTQIQHVDKWHGLRRVKPSFSCVGAN